MSDPVFTFRIKLILTVALLAIVTAFGINFLRGEAKEKAAQEAAERAAKEAMLKAGVEISP